jgi:hypothetical protein
MVETLDERTGGGGGWRFGALVPMGEGGVGVLGVGARVLVRGGVGTGSGEGSVDILDERIGGGGGWVLGPGALLARTGGGGLAGIEEEDLPDFKAAAAPRNAPGATILEPVRGSTLTPASLPTGGEVFAGDWFPLEGDSVDPSLPSPWPRSCW